MQTEKSKVFPHAPDLEVEILAACMVSEHSCQTAISVLRPENFYHTKNQEIFQAIVSVKEKGGVPDVVVVCEELKKRGTLEKVGGVSEVAMLSSKVTKMEILYDCRIVKELWVKRELIINSYQLIDMAHRNDTDTFDLIARVGKLSEELANGVSTGKQTRLSFPVNRLMRKIEGLLDEGKENMAIAQYGWKAMDKITLGLHPGDFNILAARPAMGKTSFALDLCGNVAIEQGKEVAFFSLEMSDEQLAGGFICRTAKVNKSRIRSVKGLTKESSDYRKMVNAQIDLQEAPITIFDEAGASVEQICAKTWLWLSDVKRRGKEPALIVVDYLQLISGSTKGNREQDVSTISRRLKMLAKETGLPIIALSQLSRAVETRGGDKRPQLSDLRESGAIEQDADSVMFLYRPEYYNIMEDEEGNSMKGITEVILGKNRHGETASIPLRFDAAIGAFYDIDDDAEFATLPDAVGYGRIAPVKYNDEENLPF